MTGGYFCEPETAKQAYDTKLNHLSDVIHEQKKSLDESFAASTDRLEEWEGERVQSEGQDVDEIADP